MACVDRLQRLIQATLILNSRVSSQHLLQFIQRCRLRIKESSLAFRESRSTFASRTEPGRVLMTMLFLQVDCALGQ